MTNQPIPGTENYNDIGIPASLQTQTAPGPGQYIGVANVSGALSIPTGNWPAALYNDPVGPHRRAGDGGASVGNCNSSFTAPSYAGCASKEGNAGGAAGAASTGAAAGAAGGVGRAPPLMALATPVTAGPSAFKMAGAAPSTALAMLLTGFMAAPGITNIAEGIRAMGVQKDIKGLRRLNISPVFFLAPKALEGTSEVFFKSEKFSDHSTVATDSSFATTRTNPYSGSYFQRIYEPRLDDDSEHAWYLLGPKGRTVKVVFLNGVQAPLMEMRQPGFTIEGMEYVVSIDAGAYATDYRAMYRNEGD
jgi:hypothetical protein